MELLTYGIEFIIELLTYGIDLLIEMVKPCADVLFEQLTSSPDVVVMMSGNDVLSFPCINIESFSCTAIGVCNCEKDSPALLTLPEYFPKVFSNKESIEF